MRRTALLNEDEGGLTEPGVKEEEDVEKEGQQTGDENLKTE